MELDPSRVRLLGDPDTPDGQALLAELYDAYLGHTRASLVGLQDAMAAGDRSRVRALAHEQNGASGMIGAASIAAAFAGIEQAPADVDAVGRALELIREALGRLAPEVDNLTGRPGPT